LPMRRVLHVHDRSLKVLGGAEVLLARTCDLLRTAGWDVRTFTEDDLSDRRATAFRYIHNRTAIRELRQALGEFKPDVVHLHNYYHLLSPAILPLLARYKKESGAWIVMTAHDYHLVCPNSGGNWFRNGPRLADVDRLRSWRYLLTRRWDHRGLGHSTLKLLQHVWHYRLHDRRHIFDLVICTCRFLQELVAALGVPAAHLANPGPPITASVSPSATLTARGETLKFIFAGRIEPEKGIRRFLESLPADFTPRLAIVGDGGDRAACEAICKSRGFSDRIEFLGRRTHEETVNAIAAAHVLVVPSLLFETYPLVAQEALTVGTNILVADYGGMREVVLDAGIGYRFQPDQPATLAKQLREIQAAHEAGTLNTFDPSVFLAKRTEANYLAGLERAYSGEPA
jgi:glycosyltransferase involved in cell wall biosynthesis